MYAETCFIGLGANLDDPQAQLQQALTSLDQAAGIELLKVSSFYGSKPQGPQDQPDFINAVCQIKTSLSPQQLLESLQSIEKSQGRIKKRHWGERVIDLDILLYDDQVIDSATLQVPHPQMIYRDFVLVPLAEIASDLTIPRFGELDQLIGRLDTSYLISL